VSGGHWIIHWQVGPFLRSGLSTRNFLISLHSDYSSHCHHSPRLLTAECHRHNALDPNISDPTSESSHGAGCTGQERIWREPTCPGSSLGRCCRAKPGHQGLTGDRCHESRMFRQRKTAMKVWLTFQCWPPRAFCSRHRLLAVLVCSKYFADRTRTVFHARETARSGERRAVRMMRNPDGCHLFHMLHFLPAPQLCSPSLATTPPKHHFNPTPDRMLKRTAKLWIPWNPYHGKMPQMRLGNRLHPDRPRIRGTGI
jgi:hypothetical protein